MTIFALLLIPYLCPLNAIYLFAWGVHALNRRAEKYPLKKLSIGKPYIKKTFALIFCENSNMSVNTKIRFQHIADPVNLRDLSFSLKYSILTYLGCPHPEQKNHETQKELESDVIDR